MGFFDELIGGAIDKERMTRDTVQNALHKVAEELGRSAPDFFLMILPVDKDFNHKYFICEFDASGNPKKVREISLKEILSE